MIKVDLIEHTLPRTALGQYRMIALPNKNDTINFARDGYVWKGRVFAVEHFLHLELDPSVAVIVSHVGKVSR